MNNLTLLLSQNDNFKLVKAIFPSSPNTYTYKTTLDIKEDQYAVVQTASGPKIVLIVEVLDPSETSLSFPYELKWLVQTVSFEHYDKCVELDKQVNKQLNALEFKNKRESLLDGLKSTIGKDGVDTVTKLVRL